MAINNTTELSTFGYQTEKIENQFVITTKDPVFFFTLVGVVGIFITFLGVAGNLEFLILLIPILALPFIHDSWKFPSTINFNSKEGLLSLTRPLFTKIHLAYSDIKNVSVSKTVQWSGTSAFEEGNKDIIYRVYLELGDNKFVRLMKIKSRKEIPSEIHRITNLANKLIGSRS